MGLTQWGEGLHHRFMVILPHASDTGLVLADAFNSSDETFQKESRLGSNRLHKDLARFVLEGGRGLRGWNFNEIHACAGILFRGTSLS